MAKKPQTIAAENRNVLGDKIFAMRAAHYRPEIDGIRAIAVLGVLAYHLFPNFVPSGFVGVDVFFVISGYLIGDQILRSTWVGDFHFKEFYLRRVRRLAPALLIVLLANLVVSALIQSPHRLERIAEYSLWAVAGLSNNRFIFGSSYEEGSAQANPLLHTWSLGVEEQFYLVLPAIVLLTAKLVGRQRLTIVLTALAITSLVLAIVLAYQGIVNANFYGLPTRAWELLAGVLLAKGQHDNLAERIKLPGPELAWRASSLVIVISSMVFQEELISGPRLQTLVTVGATALILYPSKKDFVNELLSKKPIVYIGQISYPLYLWHFPLLGLAGWMGWFGYWHLLIVLVISAGLASLTFHFVEKPIRFKYGQKSWLIVVTSLFLVLVPMAVGIGLLKGMPSRWAGLPSYSVQKIDVELTKPNQGEGQLLVVVGDSHAQTLGPSLKRLVDSTGARFAAWIIPGCPLIGNMDEIPELFIDPLSECTSEMQEKRLQWIADLEPSTVVIAGRLQYWVERNPFDNGEGGRDGLPVSYSQKELDLLDINQKVIEDQITLSVSRILDAGHKVILVYPVPEAGWSVPDELKRRYVLNGFNWPLNSPLDTSYSQFQKRTQRAYEVLDAVGESSVLRVYPERVFCNQATEGRCATHSDTLIYYRDADHLTEAGSDLVAAEIFSSIK